MAFSIIQVHQGAGSISSVSHALSAIASEIPAWPHQSIVLTAPLLLLHVEMTTNMKTRAQGWQFQPALFVLDPQKLCHQMCSVWWCTPHMDRVLEGAEKVSEIARPWKPGHLAANVTISTIEASGWSDIWGTISVPKEAHNACWCRFCII